MEQSKVKSYYERYRHAASKYGFRSIHDCYNNPSEAKVSAERAIIDEMRSKDGYGYSVISYNTSVFTGGYMFSRGREFWFAVHTPSYYGEMKVKEY